MMMNDYYANQQQNNDNTTTLVGDMNGVVCPKPRRFNPSIISISSPRSHHHHYPIHETEVYESKARTELLDMILTKEFYDVEKANNLVPSSPPYFCGSPPTRASNPVVQDVQFANENMRPLTPVFDASPPSSARKNGGSCGREQLGQKRPKVRVEGFKCRGISAVA